jgi:hypothetical protein
VGSGASRAIGLENRGAAAPLTRVMREAALWVLGAVALIMLVALLSYSGQDPGEALEAMSRLVELKLKDFGVEVEVVAVQPGPVITRFEMQPAPGVKVSQISGLPRIWRARCR